MKKELKKHAKLKQIHVNNLKIYFERGGPENETSETDRELQPHQATQKKKKASQDEKNIGKPG